MAFRKASLDAIGGFDPQFRIAGDDVDICWRLQDQGWTVGLQPRRRRLAPPPRLRARLPEAAVRVRQGRGAARAQVAGALQPHGAPRLGRPRLRRAAREGARRPLEDLLRHLGHGPVPVGLPARARHPRLAAADAGVVPRDRAAGRPVAARHHVDAAAAGGAAAVAAVGALVVQGRARRRARKRHVRRRVPPPRATHAADHDLPLHGPAGRPARRAPAPRPVALAAPLGAPPGPADPAHDAASGASAGARPTSACGASRRRCGAAAA